MTIDPLLDSIADYLAQHPQQGPALVKRLRGLPVLDRALIATFGVRVTAPDFGDQVETEATAAQLSQLFQRIATQWEELGDLQPYWSVLTHDHYYRERLDPAALDDFYATGRLEADRLGLLLRRFHLTPPTADLIDFGCGVGRIAEHLLALGYRVLGIDVSAGNLAVARERHTGAGHAFSTLHLRDLAGLDALPRASVLLSYGTLQHNPPPVQRELLRRLLGALRPGGVALFQLPTYQPGYVFSIPGYLDTAPSAAMEMHCLPMAVVLAIVREAGLILLDIQQDDWAGADFQSQSFLAHRPPP